MTNSSEIKEVTWNKTAESSDSVDNKERSFGEKCGRLLCPSSLRSSALNFSFFERPIPRAAAHAQTPN